MNTLTTTTSELRINPATSLEYLATLISQRMTPPSGHTNLPEEQFDSHSIDSKLDNDTHGRDAEAHHNEIPPSPTPGLDNLMSPPPTPSSSVDNLLTASCPFDDYVLWGALMTSTPQSAPKPNARAIPENGPRSPSLSDSDISEIQVIPLRLDDRSLRSSPSTASRESDNISSYSSPPAGSPVIKDEEIAQEYEFLADWLTGLNITAPLVDAQVQHESVDGEELPAETDLGDLHIQEEDHCNEVSNDDHEASDQSADVSMEMLQPIQQELAPKVSYSLLRHFEEFNTSFDMTPPKILNYAQELHSSCSSPSLKKVSSNASSRSSDKHVTTPKMLKFKRDLSRKTRKAKKGILEFSWKMKNRFQEQYNANFKSSSATKGANGTRLAGCRGDFGCIGNDSFGYSPPVMDWAFEVPAGLAINAGSTGPLKTSRSSAFNSLKSVPEIIRLDEKLKASKRVAESVDISSPSLARTPSMHTISSWSFSTGNDDTGYQSPTCAGSEPTSASKANDLITNNGIDIAYPTNQSQSQTAPSSDIKSPETTQTKVQTQGPADILSPSIPYLEGDNYNQNKPKPIGVGISTHTLADVNAFKFNFIHNDNKNLNTYTSTPTPPPCMHCFLIHPQIPDNASISAGCNSPALATTRSAVSGESKNTEEAPRGFGSDLKIDCVGDGVECQSNASTLRGSDGHGHGQGNGHGQGYGQRHGHGSGRTSQDSTSTNYHKFMHGNPTNYKGKEKLGSLSHSNTDTLCTGSQVTDYLGLGSFTLGSGAVSTFGSGVVSTLTSSKDPLVSESIVKLPGAYVFDDGDLDASRSFSAALGRAYKLLFDQAAADG